MLVELWRTCLFGVEGISLYAVQYTFIVGGGEEIVKRCLLLTIFYYFCGVF